MHTGRPYGLHSVGLRLTDKDQAFIDATAKRFTNLKDVSKIDSLKLVYELPDGGSFIIQDAGGNFRVIAHKPTESKQLDFDGLARSEVPMLYSGAITGRAVLRPNQGLRLNISRLTQKRLAGYDPKRTTAPKTLELMRFVCEYGPQFREFLPEQVVSGIVYTQYEQQRPTWYSGAMSEVMQIVGGYGKQKIDSLPDNPYERAQFIIPNRYQHLIEKEIKGVRLPAYTGLPNAEGQFQCDYKFLKTNTVAFDGGGSPWLMQIDASGVWAMPLPVIAATTTVAFRNYVEEVGDIEILSILDRFGGMPSGESFPLGATAFQAWRRAGVIIKVCDTKDFYDHLPYSSAMGWSTNTSGNEAVNTAYSIDWGNGNITAVAYKLSLRLGSANNNGWVSDYSSNSNKTDYEMSYISDYLSKLYELIKENTPVNIAIKYKLRSVPIDVVQQRAAGAFSRSEVDYWNNLEISPIATHVGNVVKIDDGAYTGGQAIKIPEPMLKGCVSLPLIRSNAAYNPKKKDTIVLAYYIGDSLKTVKLFQDETLFTQQPESNFEDYMYVGQWYKKEMTAQAQISGNLYTTDIDDRVVTSTGEKETVVEGKDLGYSVAHLAMDFYFWRTGTIRRYRWYTTETKSKFIADRSLSFAATIPYFFRNAFIYAKQETYSFAESSHSFSLNSVADPYQYRVWSDNEQMLMFGSLPIQKGSPYPVDGKPVYAEIQEYYPAPINAWADNGPWVQSLPSDITHLLYDYHDVVWAFKQEPPPPPVNAFSNSSTIYGGKGDSLLRCQIFDRVEKIRDEDYLDAYYNLSPNLATNVVFYEDGCKVVFGSKRYANISEVTETGNRKQWGESDLVDNKSAHHFIGVINE